MSFSSEPEARAAGLKAAAPTWFGTAAWGLVVGVAMIKAGLTVAQALGMTLLVYAGSAQLASLPLMAAHAPLWVIFITALVVNLRFVIFSAILAPHFVWLPWHKRLWMGYLTGDMAVGLFSQRFPGLHTAVGKLSFLKALIYPNWLAWQMGSILGILAGSQIPAGWGLGFAGTLAILCVMLPLVQSRATLFGVAVSGAMALLAYPLPYKLGLLLAVLTGMVAAMFFEEVVEARLFPRESTHE